LILTIRVLLPTHSVLFPSLFQESKNAIIVGSNSRLAIWVSQDLSFETIWHTAIVYCLPIASISHGTSLMSIPGKGGHIDLVRGRRPSHRLPIWTYGALSLGCSTTSVISGMKPSTSHKILRPIIFHRSACLPLGIFVMPTSVYTKTLMQPRQHSRPILTSTTPSWTNHCHIPYVILIAIAITLR